MIGETTMTGNLIPQMPVTQESQAVKTLIEFVTGKPCEELPEVFKLANGVQLTRSSKGDAYYVTSAQGCTCRGYVYRHRCKHMAALEEDTPAKTAAQIYQEKQRARKALAKTLPPVDSIKPTESWANGYNGPVEAV